MRLAGDPFQPNHENYRYSKSQRYCPSCQPKHPCLCGQHVFDACLPTTTREGADIVVHGATKYLSGHNDMLAGCVIAKSKEIADTFKFNFNTTGVTLNPFDSWLLLRSLKTLSVRMARHTSNAKYVAACLAKLPQVEKVLYPGVGGMISFYLKDMKQVDRLFKHLKIISFAESLGGVESLLTIPSLQTHSDMSKEARLKLGITDELLRLSTGLEIPRTWLMI